MDLSDYGLSKETLQTMYDEWQRGISKSAIERRYLGKATHHGKLFTKLVREYLNIETEKQHPLKCEVDRLRSLLRDSGIDPDTGVPNLHRIGHEHRSSGPKKPL
jgi:hypothetical protein